MLLVGLGPGFLPYRKTCWRAITLSPCGAERTGMIAQAFRRSIRNLIVGNRIQPSPRNQSVPNKRISCGPVKERVLTRRFGPATNSGQIFGILLEKNKDLHRQNLRRCRYFILLDLPQCCLRLEAGGEQQFGSARSNSILEQSQL